MHKNRENSKHYLASGKSISEVGITKDIENADSSEKFRMITRKCLLKKSTRQREATLTRMTSSA